MLPVPHISLVSLCCAANSTRRDTHHWFNRRALESMLEKFFHFGCLPHWHSLSLLSSLSSAISPSHRHSAKSVELISILVMCTVRTPVLVFFLRLYIVTLDMRYIHLCFRQEFQLLSSCFLISSSRETAYAPYPRTPSQSRLLGSLCVIGRFARDCIVKVVDTLA